MRALFDPDKFDPGRRRPRWSDQSARTQGITCVARGRLAEDAAAAFLEQNEVAILDRNYRSPVGELDIVGVDADTTVVVEVKARSSANFGEPLEAVGPLKERRLRAAAAWWMAENGMAPEGIRFDVIAVQLGPGGGLRALFHWRDVLGECR